MQGIIIAGFVRRPLDCCCCASDRRRGPLAPSGTRHSFRKKFGWGRVLLVGPGLGLPVTRNSSSKFYRRPPSRVRHSTRTRGRKKTYYASLRIISESESVRVRVTSTGSRRTWTWTPSRNLHGIEISQKRITNTMDTLYHRSHWH